MKNLIITQNHTPLLGKLDLHSAVDYQLDAKDENERLARDAWKNKRYTDAFRYWAKAGQAEQRLAELQELVYQEIGHE